MFEASTLGTLDLTFLAASLAFSVLIGLHFANKNKTFADYARGGGNQNLWAVSASMAASYCGALTLIGNPSELYMHGTSFTLKMATAILAWPVSSFVLLPVFKRLDGVSIFQYIENRFSPWLRRFVSLLFVFQMTFYSAVSLYLPSLPLLSSLRIPQTVSVGLIGLVCIIYCSFGGIKAVTWTNLYHTILVIGTMLTILVVGTLRSGGLAGVLGVALESGRLSLGPDYLSLDLTTRHTLYNTIFGYTLVRLFLHGTSQMQVQSALSLSTMRRSQASQLISAVFYFLTQVLASAIGLLLVAAYQQCDPYLNGEIRRQDELLMHYLRKSLGATPLLQGMFIAAVFGSTLTTMSSYLSSTSAMLVDDFVQPLHARCTGRKLADSRSALVGKLTAILLGVLCVVLTLEMDRISGLQQATTTLYGVIGTPILSAFLLGVLTRYVNSPGMFAGMLASIAFGLCVFVSHVVDRPPLEPSLPISVAGCSAPSLVGNISGPVRLLYADLASPLSDLFPAAALELGQTPAGPVVVSALTAGGARNQSAPLLAVRQVDVQPAESFHISTMSYLWLPLFTMAISVLVASCVSLLTGGMGQSVDERFMAPDLTKALAAKTKEKLKQLQLGGKSSCTETIESRLADKEAKQASAAFKFDDLDVCCTCCGGDGPRAYANLVELPGKNAPVDWPEGHLDGSHTNIAMANQVR